MGYSFHGKAVVLILCLALTAVLLQGAHSPSAPGPEARVPLSAVMTRIPGWRIVQGIPLAGEIRQELQVDDYAFLTLTNGRDKVSLYVGFYRQAEKVGAAHHPLVCFSGQGWEISAVEQETVRMADGEQVSWSTMTARRDPENEFIAYWFQAHDRAAASPFLQKVALARNKLLASREDSAFIRISFPIGNRDPVACRHLAMSFLQAFYPVYLGYVRNEI